MDVLYPEYTVNPRALRASWVEFFDPNLESEIHTENCIDMRAVMGLSCHVPWFMGILEGVYWKNPKIRYTVYLLLYEQGFESLEQLQLGFNGNAFPLHILAMHQWWI